MPYYNLPMHDSEPGVVYLELDILCSSFLFNLHQWYDHLRAANRLIILLSIVDKVNSVCSFDFQTKGHLA